MIDIKQFVLPIGYGIGLWLIYWATRRSQGSVSVKGTDRPSNTIDLELPTATG